MPYLPSSSAYSDFKPMLDIMVLFDVRARAKARLCLDSRQEIPLVVLVDSVQAPVGTIRVLLQCVWVHIQPAADWPPSTAKLKLHADFTRIAASIPVGPLISKMNRIVCDPYIKRIEKRLTVLGEKPTRAVKKTVEFVVSLYGIL